MSAPAACRRSFAPIVARLASLVFAAAAAFSVAQTPPASDVRDAPATAAQDAPASPTVDIALVLPLETPAYARAADAVRAGFMAAADAAASGLRTKVYGHGEDGVLPAVEAAREAGAKVIVGPLVRDDVKVVATMATDLPYLIALNQLDEGIAATPRLYTFALSIESDARLLARRLASEVLKAGGTPAPTPASGVVVISADTPLLKRFAGAFAAEWTMAGGSAPGAYRFDAKPAAMTAMRREIMRKLPGAVLLALDGPAPR